MLVFRGSETWNRTWDGSKPALKGQAVLHLERIHFSHLGSILPVYYKSIPLSELVLTVQHSDPQDNHGAM